LKMASMRWVRTHFSQSPHSAADLVWAWIASMKRTTALVHPTVTRVTRGAGSPPVAFWEEIAIAVTGWTRGERRSASYAQLRQLTIASKMLQVMLKNHPLGEVAIRTRAPMYITAAQVEQARQAVKGYIEVKRGGSAYVWTCVAWLMRSGWVEGHVYPKFSERWWEQQAELMPAGVPCSPGQTQELTMVEDAAEQFVVVDLFAGTQSLRWPTLSMGWGYVPLDAREYVYSAVKDCVVRNVVVDVSKHTPASLRDLIERQLLAQFPRALRIKWMVCWASEDCSTFSKMDQINTRRGTAYRDSTHPSRPPLNPETSSYGAKAVAADARVKNTVEMLLELHRSRGLKTLREGSRRVILDTRDVQVLLENPVGNMQYQPYIRRSFPPPTVIDYCAYCHPYKKPTHLWHFMHWWRPAGTTGTGRCGGVCAAGAVNPLTGRYKHTYTMGADSRSAVKGIGRRESKHVVPGMLLMEVMRTLSERAGKYKRQ
jgi:hypothetical protein